MSLVRQTVRALSLGFRPLQLYNRALYELHARFRLINCNYSPVWLHFFVTSRCNFRCLFCTNHAEAQIGKIEIGYHRPVPDLDYDTFRRSLDRYRRAMVCTFCGVGEPFMNTELFRMIEYAKSMSMITEVVTNGSYLRKNHREAIFRAGLDRITISLLESDQSRHDELINIKNEPFARILEDIATLGVERSQSGAKLEIKVSRLLTMSTLRRANEFIELAIKLGVDKVIFNNLIFAEITAFELSECLFDEDYTRRYFQELDKQYAHVIDIEFPILIKKQIKEKTFGCKWYWKNMCIDSAGSVSGCGRFITPKPAYGNIADNDVWNNAHFKEMRRSFIEQNVLDCCINCVESSSSN